MITDIKQEDFEKEVLQADRPVVADFWAPWCGYCRRLSPVVDRLEKEYGDRVRFVKVDIDDNAALADTYRVDTIPTLIMFREGKAVGAVVNPGSQSAITDWIEEKTLD